ncbi:MAG: acyl-CoA reductase [Flavobacteriaceae bacterium]|nr:MAG: acyl-CoA reductase [Flavobacteriaceae bacterium]
MDDLNIRIKSFIKLGAFLQEYCEYSNKPMDLIGIKKQWFDEFDQELTLSGHKNGWHTKENILYNLKKWSELLTESNLNAWLNNYDLGNTSPKKVALILAGNIPLVGFHDFLSALITGNKVLIKASSNDAVLLPFLVRYLVSVAPSLENEISFIEGKLKDYDCVIATGSNNTARYFEHYFGSKPNIIRKSRNSVAVLTGNETQEQLFALGEDIFQYYGLGCRSVSKLFVPIDYDFDVFFKAIFPYSSIIDGIKYSNNYDYNKAVYLMSEFKILDNGFLILKEDESYASPIASLFYERYESKAAVIAKLNKDREKLQCIVAKGITKDETPFGQTQTPSLTDYADGVDTVEFLLKT